MKILLDSVGCRLNQSEIEKMAFKLRNYGHEIVSRAADADVAIINTCTVTSAAAADSRKLIRRIAREGCVKILTTGCLSTIDPDRINSLPSVIRSYSNNEKDFLADNRIFNNTIINNSKISRKPLPGKNKRTRAFIKIQDGCDNFCSFCITRIARGKGWSVSKEEIFADITYALSGDVKEIVLTGVNIGSWGKDFRGACNLAGLIRDILGRFDIPRIRLSSIEPWDIDDAVLELLQHPSFCHHFHIPLQSGCDATLQRMGRRITTREFGTLVEKIRSIDENTAITTDIIVGFPGETLDEFQQSLAFIRAMDFSGGHVFRYSPRAGTPASSFPNPVSNLIKKERSKLMRNQFQISENNFLKKHLRKELDVLWEKSDKKENGKYYLAGITDNYISVQSESIVDRYNEISRVKISEIKENKVIGEIL